MEWPNECVLDFLEYYQNEPVIWNASLHTHKNRNMVHDAWRRIEDLEYKYSITDLKKKKDSLMASYRTCHAKVKRSIRNGAGADEVYKPNWFAYAKMVTFLGDKDQTKETINSEEINYQEQIENEDADVESTDTVASNSKSSTEQAGTENDGIVLPPGLNSSLKVPFSKNKKNSATDDIKRKVNEAYSVLQSSVQRSAKKKDICDLYGELVAEKLRLMDDQTREITMNRMDNLFFEMKMKQSVVPNYNYYNLFPQQNFTTLPPRPFSQNCESEAPLSQIDPESSSSINSYFPSAQNSLLNSPSSRFHSEINPTSSIPETSYFPVSQNSHINSSSSNSSVSNYPSPYKSKISSPSQNCQMSSDSDNVREYYKNVL